MGGGGLVFWMLGSDGNVVCVSVNVCIWLCGGGYVVCVEVEKCG